MEQLQILKSAIASILTDSSKKDPNLISSLVKYQTDLDLWVTRINEKNSPTNTFEKKFIEVKNVYLIFS